MGFTTETATNADKLLAGSSETVQIPVTVVSGQTLTRGTVVGRIDRGAGTIAAGTNTGNGTCTGTVTVGANAKTGVYTLKCVATGTNTGTFQVTTPTGERLPDAVVGTAYSSGHFSGVTINDGSTDFALADTFTVTIAVGSGKWKAYSSANTDGSEIARGIAAHAVDASGGDEKASIFIAGEFNRAALTGIDTAGERKLGEFGIIVKGAI